MYVVISTTKSSNEKVNNIYFGTDTGVTSLAYGTTYYLKRFTVTKDMTFLILGSVEVYFGGTINDLYTIYICVNKNAVPNAARGNMANGGGVAAYSIYSAKIGDTIELSISTMTYSTSSAISIRDIDSKLCLIGLIQ